MDIKEIEMIRNSIKTEEKMLDKVNRCSTRISTQNWVIGGLCILCFYLTYQLDRANSSLETAHRRISDIQDKLNKLGYFD